MESTLDTRQLRRSGAGTALAATLLIAAIGAYSEAAEPAASAVEPTPGLAAPTTAALAMPPLPRDADFTQLQEHFDARLGVYAVDTGSGRAIGHRADERFAYASTFKALAAAVVLQQTSTAQLDKVVSYTRDDLARWSPITEKHLGTGMTLRELCDAAVRFSDNTAANLLLRELGGPGALAAALEAVGDDVIHVSRYEPELNQALPGDDRDTSTPRAMASTLRAFAVDGALSSEDRAQLMEWLRGNTTGADLIRAGVPEGWDVGDRTGDAAYGTRNDIAVVWPPGRAPIVLAVMSSRDEQAAGHDDALIAGATRAVIDALG